MPRPSADELAEWLTCAESPAYFLNTYCQIYTATSPTGGYWHPFTLWPAQVGVLQQIRTHPLTVILKSRQMGLSWEVLAYALWKMLFHPITTVGVFSRREEEAVYLLGEERLRGMYARLPAWMQVRAVLSDNDKRWELSNGSIARAFPTSAGDSYVNTLAIADEFDLVEDQRRLINAVKPTIDAGGQMILVSRVDKTRPDTLFKRIYQEAAAGQNGWAAIFLPWYARPDRTPAWYAGVRADVLANTGTLDDLHEQYPATDVEALAQRTGDKRLPPAWLLACYAEQAPLADAVVRAAGAPALAGLVVYALPELLLDGYVIGADPAEGNPTSDDSAATVLTRRDGRQVARWVGKLEPTLFGAGLAALARWYTPALPQPRPADTLIERNNHGHQAIAAYRAAGLTPALGRDGKWGWLTSAPSKTALYDTLAGVLRDADTQIADLMPFTQLGSIEGITLSAPPGLSDDEAMAFALATMARTHAVADLAPIPALAARLAAYRG